MEQYAIEMLNITKRFPGIIANDNITLQLKKGEIHALLGENGAGKSTLMSVLFGLYQAEEGVIKKDGVEIEIKNPNDASAYGIGMVHQHFKLVECFSVLDNIILGVEPNKSVLHDSVKNHLANCRQGTQSALTKGEVSYTTRKPWRQKGTGRARAGYAGSPVWTHGGVAFAPKPRDYSYTLNKKVKRIALKSALSAKAAEDEIIVIDGLKMDEIKTKTFKTFLDKVGVEGKALVVTENVEENVVKSARNIAGVTTTIATILSPYMILTSGKMVVDKAALAKIEEVFA